MSERMPEPEPNFNEMLEATRSLDLSSFRV